MVALALLPVLMALAAGFQKVFLYQASAVESFYQAHSLRTAVAIEHAQTGLIPHERDHQDFKALETSLELKLVTDYHVTNSGHLTIRNASIDKSAERLAWHPSFFTEATLSISRFYNFQAGLTWQSWRCGNDILESPFIIESPLSERLKSSEYRLIVCR